MSGWAITFLVIAAMAAFLGFGGVAAATAGAAQVLFFIALSLLFGTLLLAALHRRGRSASGAANLVVGVMLGVAALISLERGASQAQRTAVMSGVGFVTIDDQRAVRDAAPQRSE